MWVLRFRLMVERGPHSRPQASEGEAQHGPFCRTRRFSQVLHRASPDLQRMKLCYSATASSTPRLLLAWFDQALLLVGPGFLDHHILSPRVCFFLEAQHGPFCRTRRF